MTIYNSAKIDPTNDSYTSYKHCFSMIYRIILSMHTVIVLTIECFVARPFRNFGERLAARLVIAQNFATALKTR
jgi:hypothetical protein